MISPLAQFVHGLRLKWYIRRVKRAMVYHKHPQLAFYRAIWIITSVGVVASIILG